MVTENARFTSLELCAGAGGMSLGLEQAGFDPVLLIDEDSASIKTLFVNRPQWQTFEGDLVDFVAGEHGAQNVDLLAAGLPRLRGPAAAARHDDAYERRLIQATGQLAAEVRPRAVLIENGPGLVEKSDLESVRRDLHDELEHLGFKLQWFVLDAKDFGVPQTRRHGFMVALLPASAAAFKLPAPKEGEPATVAQTLLPSMRSRGWSNADAWAVHARRPAPTIVGGSKRHGGADLGPTGSKKAWATMNVDGNGVADEPPGAEHGDGPVRLTVAQVALLQGFPPDWRIPGRKTPAYKQVGHAVPPPLAAAVGRSIAEALSDA